MYFDHQFTSSLKYIAYLKTTPQWIYISLVYPNDLNKSIIKHIILHARYANRESSIRILFILRIIYDRLSFMK